MHMHVKNLNGNNGVHFSENSHSDQIAPTYLQPGSIS